MPRSCARTITESATGNRYEYQSKQSWGKVYHSFNGGRDWNQSKRAAFLIAKDANQLQPEGMIRVTQDGQTDTFRPRTVDSNSLKSQILK